MIVMSLLRSSGLLRPQTMNVLKQDSLFSQQLIRSLRTTKNCGANKGQSPHFLQVTPSRWQWHKYKDLLHFYIFLGVIPLSAVVLYSNIYIGPATLSEIPEGYVPKQWEYFQHPITRWFARYWINNFQERYERNIYYITMLDERRRMRLLQWKCHRLMRERGDDPNNYTSRTQLSKYIRGMQLGRDYLEDITGQF